MPTEGPVETESEECMQGTIERLILVVLLVLIFFAQEDEELATEPVLEKAAQVDDELDVDAFERLVFLVEL